MFQQKLILEKAGVPHKKTQNKKLQKLNYHRNVPGLPVPLLIVSTCQSIADASSLPWFTGGCLKGTGHALFCFLKSFIASSPYSKCPFGSQCYLFSQPSLSFSIQQPAPLLLKLFLEITYYHNYLTLL